MTTCSAQQIRDGDVIAFFPDRPTTVAPQYVLDHRQINGVWGWAVVFPAAVPMPPEPVRRQTGAQAAAPVVPTATGMSWGRFFLWLPVAIFGGILLSRIVHSPLGREVGRAAVRGTVYKLMKAI